MEVRSSSPVISGTLGAGPALRALHHSPSTLHPPPFAQPSPSPKPPPTHATHAPHRTNASTPAPPPTLHHETASQNTRRLCLESPMPHHHSSLLGSTNKLYPLDARRPTPSLTANPYPPPPPSCGVQAHPDAAGAPIRPARDELDWGACRQCIDDPTPERMARLSIQMFGAVSSQPPSPQQPSTLSQPPTATTITHTPPPLPSSSAALSSSTFKAS